MITVTDRRRTEISDIRAAARFANAEGDPLFAPQNRRRDLSLHGFGAPVEDGR